MPITCVLDFTRSIQRTHDEHHFLTKTGPRFRSRKIPVTPPPPHQTLQLKQRARPRAYLHLGPRPVYHHEGRAHSFAQGAPRVAQTRRLRHTLPRPLSSPTVGASHPEDEHASTAGLTTEKVGRAAASDRPHPVVPARDGDGGPGPRSGRTGGRPHGRLRASPPRPPLPFPEFPVRARERRSQPKPRASHPA